MKDPYLVVSADWERWEEVRQDLLKTLRRYKDHEIRFTTNIGRKLPSVRGFKNMTKEEKENEYGM